MHGQSWDKMAPHSRTVAMVVDIAPLCGERGLGWLSSSASTSALSPSARRHFTSTRRHFTSARRHFNLTGCHITSAGGQLLLSCAIFPLRSGSPHLRVSGRLVSVVLAVRPCFSAPGSPPGCLHPAEACGRQPVPIMVLGSSVVSQVGPLETRVLSGLGQTPAHPSPLLPRTSAVSTRRARRALALRAPCSEAGLSLGEGVP